VFLVILGLFERWESGKFCGPFWGFFKFDFFVVFLPKKFALFIVGKF
jgi:hypothetical protein